ncbi:hypothetical protein RUR49_20255 [Pseudoxanthobacter sp. M-2]|uniref:hypothetical protein n=1 Tax=Pseudoxanthobacter sp. M-2 TaxID=3078754 RepID=UPI0038FD3C19
MRHRDRAAEAGRDPGVGRPSRYADTASIDPADEPLLDTAFGHEDGAMLEGGGNPVEAEARAIPIDAQPMSEVTGRPDPGTTFETIDGLDETEEATRRAAEDYAPDRDRMAGE